MKTAAQIEAVSKAREAWLRVGGTIAYVATLRQLDCSPSEILRLLEHTPAPAVRLPPL